MSSAYMTVNLSNSCNKYTSSKWVLEQTAGSRWTYKPPGRAKGPMKSRVAFEPPQVGGPVGFMGDSVRHRLLSLSVGWLSFKRRLSLLAGSESCFRSNQMCKALWTVQSVLLKESWLTEANQQGGGAVRVRLRTWDFQSSALFKRQEPSPCHQWDHRMSIGNVGSRLEAQDCVPSCPWRPRVTCTCVWFVSRRACPSLSWEVTRSTKWMASGSSAEKLPGGSLKVIQYISLKTWLLANYAYLLNTCGHSHCPRM